MPEIDDQIRKPINDGKFDDLPGKGKPLNLDENPHVDPDWRLAHHMLQKQRLHPAVDRGAPGDRGSRSRPRAALWRAWEWHGRALAGGQPASQVEAEWRRAQQVFAEQVEKINQKIFDYNLQTPSEKFQLMKLNAGKEILRQ